MKRTFSVLTFFLVAVLAVSAQLTFNINDLLGVKRVSDPQLSPDGRSIAFTVGVVDKAANKVINQIYVMELTAQNKSRSPMARRPVRVPGGRRTANVSPIRPAGRYGR